ncbi:hypothetical protein GCM10027280_44000 [Micromonospora polyrhachis]|uniref:Terpene synthase n=1 Tax=Micromonospora polyrhachis TaxID=1282883 RepID=A0A7W7WRQ2_9ACTN|nr:terpene synthase [Micromonospora polyrhachis]MBB4961340.1 hypothetical protein [Micromonospora polyrhachis]
MRTLVATTLIGPPFVPQVNPYAGEVGARSARWAAEFGLVTGPDAATRLGRANAADLAGRACPDAEPEQLALLTDLVTWLFAFDDNCDDDGLGADPTRLSPAVARLLDVLDRLGGDAPARAVTTAEPAATALHDLCRRVRRLGHPRLLLRFTRQLRDYLLALLWEAANRQHQRVPAVAEYVQMRRHTGAVYPSFTLTDIAHGALPTAERLADPVLSALDALAADLVCWCNDAFSYDKERRLESTGHNLTNAIARETGKDERSALAETVDRFNSGLATYLRLEAEVLAGDDPEVVRFATARRCWIRGTYDWSMGASRYH